MKPREFRRIDRMKGILGTPSRLAEVGIGDDCAVLTPPLSDMLVTTDTLIEGVHFPAAPAWWDLVAERCLGCAVSDVAAMGGYPYYVLISLAIPDRFDDRALDLLYEGFSRGSNRLDCDIVGGDTCRSNGDVTITVTVIGGMLARGSLASAHGPNQGAPRLPRLRSQALAGDLVAVTGPLGDSAAALAVLKEGLAISSEAAGYLHTRFWRPEPRVGQGALLANESGVHAMIDISDGLGQDLGHVARQSQVEIAVSLRALPRSEALLELERRLPERARMWMLAGGEDFELLFTFAPEALPRIMLAFEHAHLRPPTLIGRCSLGRGVFLEETGEDLELFGYDHFCI